MPTGAERDTEAIHCLHFIGGHYVGSESGRVFDNVNPATEQVIGTVAEGGKAEIDKAVEAARKAYDGGWKTSKFSERASILRRMGDLILARQDELARLESLDTGKPLSLSASVDIPRAAGSYHYFANLISTMGTEAYPMEAGALNYVIRKPVGVAGLICPWNLPLLLLSAKLAPCLAMGNTVVVKPAEWTPLTATLLAEIGKEAGLPDGVLNIVHGYGGGSAGEALAEHPDVRLIAFTGESGTGRHIMRSAAGHLKRLSFELGGKNPNIVFADADLDAVVDTTVRSSFINQGEVCLCGSRIYVQSSIYAQFLERFAAKTNEMTVGDPFQPDTRMGALISKEHYERVLDYIRLAAEEGGSIVAGGGRPQGIDTGYYVEPTIIAGLTASCRIVREEVFGPVVTVHAFESEEEVIEQANDTLRPERFDLDAGHEPGIPGGRADRGGTDVGERLVPPRSADALRRRQGQRDRQAGRHVQPGLL